jgi:hypothetical protein
VVLTLLSPQKNQKANFEAEGAGRIRVRVVSRSHPVKTMFMGVITQPNEERNVSGLVSLKRLSKQQQFKEGLTETGLT